MAGLTEGDANDFNPRSPCGERPGGRAAGAADLTISIHAPRVGSDRRTEKGGYNHYDFNPRSPCGERPWKISAWLGQEKFQSTLPVWGATVRGRSRGCWSSISIHAPRVGSDVVMASPEMQALLFQSTLPVWGATDVQEPTGILRRISIHAPRVGSDDRLELAKTPAARFQSTLPVWGATLWVSNLLFWLPDFNPRSPCGERRKCDRRN